MGVFESWEGWGGEVGVGGFWGWKVGVGGVGWGFLGERGKGRGGEGMFKGRVTGKGR